MIYNVTARDCFFVSNGSNNGTTANSSNTSTNSTIKFVPLPYLIVAVLATSVAVLLSKVLHVQFYANIFASFGSLLQLSTITVTCVMII